MKILILRLTLLCVLALQCASKTPRQRGFGNTHLQKRADTHVDHVQCNHDVTGKPESFRGQESRVDPFRQYLPQPAQETRVDPSRQYLPQPGPVPPSSPPNDIEAPAASFDQPNFLSVEKTFVSPTIQNNFKSLFSQDKKDLIAPAAAQNPPTNALPPSPRITNDKKHSHDDENNLERLCNDAFHSFLCKPIKGPRKTPTGRLRPNAVIPPDVLSGLASFQNVARVKPDPPKYTAPPTTTVKPYSQFPTTRYTPPTTTTKKYEPFIPEIPSPSNNNIQILKPQPSNEAPLKTAAQTTGYFYEKPAVPFPSNQNQQFATQRPTYQPTRPTTPKPYPTKGYSYDKPNIPFPSNTIQKYAQPPKHDCDKEKSQSPFIISNPSNESPAFLRPFTPSTPKPVSKTFYTKSIYTAPSTVTPYRATIQTKPPPTHDCAKHSFSFTPSPTEKTKLPLPSNNVARIVAPSTPKPFVSYYQKPSPPPQLKISPLPAHDCKNHPPFLPTTTEKAKLPLASNNIAQIIPQPQQVNTVTISPQKSSGYFYEKPSVPFPSPKPTTPRPTPPPFTFQTTQKPNGYVYEQPRIPFPSNNIAQIISQPSTTTPKPPCEHEKPTFPVLKPAAASEAYVYDKPNKPFDGYNYEKPSNPFLLPSPANNPPQVVASPANNGYTYEKPNVPFPPQTNLPSNNNQILISPPKPSTSKPSGYSYEAPKIPFPSNINSKITSLDKPNYDARPQTQVEVTVKPGYSYDRPNNPFTEGQGYTYPEPAAPFIR